MQVRVSPDLVALLAETDDGAHHEALSRLWREVKVEIERQKQMLPVKKQEPPVPKRARFSFD